MARQRGEDRNERSNAERERKKRQNNGAPANGTNVTT